MNDCAASALYEEGVRNYNSGKYEIAAAKFYAAFMRNPFENEIRSALKNSYSKMGKKLVVQSNVYIVPFRSLFGWAGVVFLLASSVLSTINIFKRKTNLTMAAALMFTLSLPLFITWQKLDKMNDEKKIFVLSKTPLREQPLYGSSCSVELEPGDVGKLTGSRGAWLKVQFGQVKGWIPDENIAELN
ncbi:hypothetical protein JXA84_05520 [candidate division WOR-3 bacterium]|nr:hypothetical protein [candidate division WOR-3 bacterium]